MQRCSKILVDFHFTFHVFCFCLHFTLIERAQLSAPTASQPISALSIVRVNSCKTKSQELRSRTNDFVDLSWILSLVEEIKLDNESRLLFRVCVLIQVQLWKGKPFISNNNMEISDSEFNSKKLSHFLYK